MEKPAGQLEANPNLCLACAEWSDQTEIPVLKTMGTVAISESEPVVSSEDWPSRRQAA